MKTYLKIILPLVVLGLGAVALVLLIKFRKPVTPQPAEILPQVVKSVVVHLTNHQFRVHSQGTVRPRTEIQLAAEVSGKVVSMSPSFDSGGFFEKGEVLFRVEQGDFAAAVTRAKAQVAEARYRMEFERAEAEVAKQEWEKLGAGDPPSSLLLREPQVAQAQAALASAEATLEQARRDLERTEVKAPFDGRVGTKSVDIGQFVSKGSPVARIYSVDVAEVRLPLSSEQLRYVDVPLHYRGEPEPNSGAKVLLYGNLMGQTHIWTGRVDRTEGEIDDRTRMLPVVVQVQDPYGRQGPSQRPPLAAGLFVEADILGRTVDRVAIVPRSALRGASQVLVVDDSNRLRFRDVTVLRADRAQAVISAGLHEGDVVCISPLDVITDGMKVRLEAPRDETGRTQWGTNPEGEA